MKRSSRFGTLRHPDWARNTMLAADSMKSWERYPMHAEATKHVLLGRKSPGCPVAVCAGEAGARTAHDVQPEAHGALRQWPGRHRKDADGVTVECTGHLRKDDLRRSHANASVGQH